MNASQSTLLRALRGFGYTTLFLTVFQACNGNDASTPTPPAGPATLVITGISLGQGLYGDGGAASDLACDQSIGVNVQTTNWTLLPPGRCGGALQCGQLRVTLLDGSDGNTLLSVISAGNGVALDVSSLRPSVLPPEPAPYTITVELVDDSGKVYSALEGGNGSAQMAFEMGFPADCSSAAASGGTAGASPGIGGDSAGDDGTGDAGTSSTAGTSGTTGVSGTAGIAGTAGITDTAGTGGAADTGGTAGTAGNTDTSGAAGTGGSAGTAGNTDTAGTASTAGTAGA